MASWSAVQVPSTPKTQAPVLPEPGLLLCAVQETQPPGRLPLLLRTGELFLEGLHDKEARGLPRVGFGSARKPSFPSGLFI
jgi:hypothetical protein